MLGRSLGLYTRNRTWVLIIIKLINLIHCISYYDFEEAMLRVAVKG